ncbi:hypothetical protein HAX54_038714 [Datura stramonium]|uniref:Uncharacterized protein n=1 Tax=Datura stramonium TaxID=4076 RepID=A0ABS8RMW7_DATST|nr:hypothetical protein [Datura stramonium]
MVVHQLDRSQEAFGRADIYCYPTKAPICRKKELIFLFGVGPGVLPFPPADNATTPPSPVNPGTAPPFPDVASQPSPDLDNSASFNGIFALCIRGEKASWVDDFAYAHSSQDPKAVTSDSQVSLVAMYSPLPPSTGSNLKPDKPFYKQTPDSNFLSF